MAKKAKAKTPAVPSRLMTPKAAERWSIDEIVEEALLRHWSRNEFDRRIRENGLPLQKAWEARSLRLGEWKRDLEERDPAIEKESQLRRCKKVIDRCHERGDFQKALPYEQLLADLAGTREPIQIKVEVAEKQALIAVIMDLTPEAQAAAVESEQKRYLEAKKVPATSVRVPSLPVKIPTRKSG